MQTPAPIPNALAGTTLVVDEIPGRIAGDNDQPPGALTLLDSAGGVRWQTQALKMPYDAVPAGSAEGEYWVNIIRARAVWRLDRVGAVVAQVPVGGYPCSLQRLTQDHLLVAGWDDDKPGFVREYDAAGRLAWSVENLRWPWKAERLADGNTLIADAGTRRVFEVDPRGVEVWAAGNLGPAEPRLFDQLGPVYCQRLANGNTLISVRGTSQILELDRAGAVVWEVGPEIVQEQYSVVRLPNGNTLICDAGHNRVIELDPAKTVVWERGGFGYPAKAYRF